MKKDDMLEITIEDISSDGSGVGKADGFALFVKDTIPDQVKVKIKNEKTLWLCKADGNSCAVTGPHPGTVSGCQTVRRMSDPADVL